MNVFEGKAYYKNDDVMRNLRIYLYSKNGRIVAKNTVENGIGRKKWD